MHFRMHQDYRKQQSSHKKYIIQFNHISQTNQPLLTYYWQCSLSYDDLAIVMPLSMPRFQSRIIISHNVVQITMLLFDVSSEEKIVAEEYTKHSLDTSSTPTISSYTLRSEWTILVTVMVYFITVFSVAKTLLRDICPVLLQLLQHKNVRSCTLAVKRHSNNKYIVMYSPDGVKRDLSGVLNIVKRNISITY